MTLLEKINAMKMPFAELKGIKFTEADKDRVVAKMVVRPDLCTLHHTIHGGAVMAFADSVGAAASVINLPEDAKAALAGQIALGRLGEPSDIAKAVAFLAGPSAAYITGETLHVNGGMYMP